MAIRFNCTDCGSEQSFPDEMAGQRVRCSRCDLVMVAPGRAGPRSADSSRGPAPAREEKVRATRPAKTGGEPARPKRSAGTAEVRARAERPAEPDVDSESEAAEEDREPPRKKNRKPKAKPQREEIPARVWWIIGGSIGGMFLVTAAVIVAVVVMKPEISVARKAAGTDDGWVDARTAAELGGPQAEIVANILEIYAMGGECKFDKTAEYPLVAVRLHSLHATDGLMSVFRGFPGLKNLDISECQVTDEGLQQFFGMKQLEVINLKYTRVTEKGIRDLRQSLPKLRIIW
jgi:hypothetical protein